jgi:hypothetical protein
VLLVSRVVSPESLAVSKPDFDLVVRRVTGLLVETLWELQAAESVRWATMVQTEWLPLQNQERRKEMMPVAAEAVVQKVVVPALAEAVVRTARLAARLNCPNDVR